MSQTVFITPVTRIAAYVVVNDRWDGTARQFVGTRDAWADSLSNARIEHSRGMLDSSMNFFHNISMDSPGDIAIQKAQVRIFEGTQTPAIPAAFEGFSKNIFIARKPSDDRTFVVMGNDVSVFTSDIYPWKAHPVKASPVSAVDEWKAERAAISERLGKDVVISAGVVQIITRKPVDTGPHMVPARAQIAASTRPRNFLAQPVAVAKVPELCPVG